CSLIVHAGQNPEKYGIKYLPGFSPVLIEKVSIRYNPFADGRQFLNGVGVFSFMMQPFSCIQV
ncbi:MULTISPECIES: hypothetical protein, partial [Bacteroidaceae]|uniref:hypothetical protein n=1 Tax=Bacteroidaceae TaxID=815 RepID=UPI00325CC60E